MYQNSDGPTGCETTIEAPATAFLAALITLTFVMNTLARGVTETFAVFLLPVETALQTTRSEIAATYSIYMIVHGLAAPLAGQLVDRFGARTTYLTGLTLLAAANIIAGYATTIWHYYIAVGVMSGFAAACLGMVVASALLSRWFTRKLGFVMSLPHAAVGVGMFAFPLVTQLLIDRYSWREAHQLLGLGVAMLIPLMLCAPMARITRGSLEWQRMKGDSRKRGTGQAWTAMRALRTETFWALFALFFFTSAAAYAVLPHSVAFLVEKGFDKIWAAGVFGMTGALSIFGILGIGWVSDRVGRLPAVTISKLVTLTGLVCLLNVNWAPSWILVYGFVLCFGLMQGARGPIIAALVSTLFRGGSVGTIFGLLSVAMGLGAGFASLMSGILHDLTGSYVSSFTFAVIASACGLAAYWMSPSLRRERRGE